MYHKLISTRLQITQMRTYPEEQCDLQELYKHNNSLAHTDVRSIEH